LTDYQIFAVVEKHMSLREECIKISMNVHYFISTLQK